MSIKIQHATTIAPYKGCFLARLNLAGKWMNYYLKKTKTINGISISLMVSLTYRLFHLVLQEEEQKAFLSIPYNCI